MSNKRKRATQLSSGDLIASPDAPPSRGHVMQKLITIYSWASGILVAFLASYLTAVLTTALPTPKDLLCKLSLGFCPPPKLVVFGATDIDKIVDRSGVGQSMVEDQIGILHNNVYENIRRPNMVKYRVQTDTPGKYNLRVLYAAKEQRPVEISLNDQKIAPDALSELTGGWDNKDRHWSKTYPVQLFGGDNYLMLKSADVFPHLSKIEFAQVLPH